MPEITVNGKQVVIRDHFPVREFWGLADEWAKLESSTPYEEWARTVSKTVTSWEFEGNPSDPEAWGNLDMWLEFQPLVAEIGNVITARVTQAKNSVGPRS